LNNWKIITKDKTLLNMICGYRIEFSSKPVQTLEPREIKFSAKETEVVKAEVEKLLDKGVIVPSRDEPEQFISNIFVRPKKESGSFRVILNLKPLNGFIVYHHFKMESIRTCISLMQKDCFMASIDLQDAYYSIPMAQDHQKFLKFRWEGTMFQFTALPMGLTSAPRVFSKLLKPVLSTLRLQGHTVSSYIDDLYLQGGTLEQCSAAVSATVDLLNKLGFHVNLKKSHLQPTKIINHLGFILNSECMCVGLPDDKQEYLRRICESTLQNKSRVTIQSIAHLLGILVSYSTGVSFGELHFRALEREKIQALKKACGDYASLMDLQDNHSLVDLHWWIKNAHVVKPISHGSPDLILQTDASSEGWGSILLTDPVQKTGGRWSYEERSFHINVLELKAASLSLKSFQKVAAGRHILLQMDNSTAVAYLNHMGGSQSKSCNDIARDTWEWCITNNIWVSATFLPGVENFLADKESRVFNDRTEWALDQNVFDTICAHFNVSPAIDLFASRLNNKLPLFCSWKADPEAVAINAFSIAWNYNLVYLFPPFSILQQVLQKLEREGTKAILVAPNWPTQVWFSTILRLADAPPFPLPCSKGTVFLPHQPDSHHPLWKRLDLMAWSLSGKHSENQV
jgi:hypothetical protein